MKHLQVILIGLVSVSFIGVTAALGFCTFEYRPVCSKNSNNECKTDPNFCAYKLKADTDEPNAGWDLVSFDACPDQEQCPPGFACDTAGACAPGVYNSVCASDNGEFRYYENFCEYQVAKCSNPNLKVYSKGEC